MRKFYQFVTEFAEQNGIDVCVYRDGLLDTKVPHATVRVPDEETANKFMSAVKEKFNIPDGFLFYEKWESIEGSVYHEVSIFKRFFTYKVTEFLKAFKALADLKGYDTRESISRDDDDRNCPYVVIYSVTVPTVADVRELCEKHRIPLSHVEVQGSWGYTAVYLNYPDF